MNPWRGLSGLPRESYLIAIATFINRAGVMVRPFLVLYMTKQLGFSDALAGWMVALYGATTLVAAPVSGWLSDRLGSARVLRSSLTVAGLAVLLLPLAKTPLQVAVAIVLFSLFNEMPRPALMTLVAEVAPPELSKQAFVLSRLAVNLGFSIGPAAAGFLAERSFLAIFWVDGLACLLAAGMFARIRLPSHVRAARPEGSALRLLASDRALLLFFAATLLNGVVFFQHDSTLALCMTEDLGLRKPDFGLTITINTLLIVLLEVELNTRLSHWSHRKSLAIGGFLTAAGFGGLFFAHDWIGIVVTVVVWTFGEMIAMPAMSAFVTELAPAGRRGLYMSTLTLAFGGGLTIGPKLGTWIRAQHGSGTLWLAVGAIGLLSTLLYALLPDRRQAVAAAGPET